MKTYNKALHTAAISVLSLSLVGCASSTASASSSTAAASASAVGEDFASQLVSANTITVAISPDYPPFESYATDGSLQGFDVDMGNELAQYFGEGYTVEFVSMSFDTIITAVQSGQVDLGISGFTYDPDRQVAFSDPYLSSAQVVLVQKDSGISALSDLDGKSIAAQAGSTGESAAETLENSTYTGVTDAQVMIEALKTGAYDGIVLDQAVAQNYVSANANLVILEEPLLVEETCIIAKEGNDALMNKVNEVLASYMSSDAYTANKTKWELN